MATSTVPNTPKRKGKLPTFLTQEEVQAMLRVIATGRTAKKSYRDGLMIKTMYMCGLRVSEVVKLSLPDLSGRSLMVRGGKGGKDRAVPIDPVLERELATYSRLTGDRREIFPITTRAARTIVAEAARRANIQKHVSPHTLRHSFGRQCILNNVPVNVLQMWMGHAHVSTTYIYITLAGYVGPEFAGRMPSLTTEGGP